MEDSSKDSAEARNAMFETQQPSVGTEDVVAIPGGCDSVLIRGNIKTAVCDAIERP